MSQAILWLLFLVTGIAIGVPASSRLHAILKRIRRRAWARIVQLAVFILAIDAALQVLSRDDH